MFTDKDNKKYDDVMDSIESFGEKIGNKINKSGSWVLKILIISLSIIFIGGIIFIGTIIRRSVGKKE